MNPNFYVHETAVVEPGAEIGSGTKIWHFCHIMPGAVIGQNCILGQNVFIGPRVLIGNRVKVQNNVSVYEGVTLEEGVFCGPAATFTNVINPRSEIERKDKFQKTVVKRGATIGANATVLCGVTIGSYAMVGAGAVVTKDLPDHALAYGVPCQVQGWVCVCGETLPKDLRCVACGQEYRRQSGGIRLRKGADV